MTSHHGSADQRFLLSRLQAEWNGLATSPECLARAAGWRILDVELRSLDDLLVASGLGVRGHPDHGRAVLHALVRRAADDPLAARVVLQRLLPGLAADARRRSHYLTGQLDALGELLGVAWQVIREFDLSRPRPYLVNALLRSCHHHAFAQGRDHRRGVGPAAPHTFDVPVEPEETHEGLLLLVETLREARDGGLDDDDARFVSRLATARFAELAKELKVTSRTVRNRRDIVVHRVRRLVVAA